MRQLPVWALSSRVPILTALAQPTHDVVPIQVEHGESFALGAFPVSVPPGMRVSLPSDGHLPSHGHACAWQVATDEERRRLARYFVEKVELDADRRKVEIQLRLPEAPAKHMEAAAGVEPADKGFADLCLSHLATPPNEGWSGKRDSNPRPTAWEAVALPTELFPLLSLLV